MIEKINGTIPEKHPDILLLIKNTEADPMLRSAMGTNENIRYEGHYLRVTYLRYWGKDSIEGLKNSFNKTNASTQEYLFELLDVTDFEVEYDNDRYWDASFTFIAKKKN